MLENYYMSKAIKKAWRYQLLTYPNPAVGAVVVKENKIIACEAHKKAGDTHAELEVVKKAYHYISDDKKIMKIKEPQKIYDYIIIHHNNIFKNCDIYTTLEPCSHEGKTPSCAKLIKKMSFKNVYIGSLDFNIIASNGAKILKNANIDVSIGISKQNCGILLSPFYKYQQGGFCFFKLAMRADGTINHGQISSKKTTKIVHKLRSLVDLLVIGGNTVRTDRPILDTRMYKKSSKNPDVLIYSKKTNFDKTIKLFEIKHRDVTVSSNLNKATKNKFVMIEGGFDMIKAVHNHIDMTMLIVNTTTSKSEKYQKFVDKYQLLYRVNIANDTIYYLL